MPRIRLKRHLLSIVYVLPLIIYYIDCSRCVKKLERGEWRTALLRATYSLMLVQAERTKYALVVTLILIPAGRDYQKRINFSRELVTRVSTVNKYSIGNIGISAVNH